MQNKNQRKRIKQAIARILSVFFVGNLVIPKFSRMFAAELVN